jgi:hypothetical protein
MAKISKLLGGFAIAGVIGSASVADATVFTFQGNMCTDEKGYIYYPGGLAWNNHNTDDTRFECSLLRQSPDTANITDIFVEVDDGHASKEVSCLVVSCPTSGACAVSSAVGSGNAFVGSKSLSLPDVAGSTNGAAYIVCDIPDIDQEQSGVQSYRWND